MPEASGVLTPRLHVRPPVEADRARLVELFRDPSFMVFSDGPLSDDAANARVDRMLARCAEVPFAKQPIVERVSSRIVGYTGADSIEFEGREWFEWGYRLEVAMRGRGYATEASKALLQTASAVYSGDILAIIHPGNDVSRTTALKLGFTYWRRAHVEGSERDLYRLRLPRSTPE